MPDSLARRLARFAATLRFDDLPPAVIDKAKATILHNAGVGMAGHAAHAVQAARAATLASEHAGADGARLLVTGERATPAGAALVNCALMHAKLQEDAYHTGSHPGVMIIPAALALAETRGLSGRELLRAVVAGYEVEAALTADFIPRSNERGFRSSPTYGPFGAAVAAGVLLGLDEDQLTSAIGYAATFAAGTFEGGTGTDIMVLQVAQAPRSGLLAALLAAHGAGASEQSLEGQIGFYYAFTGGRDGLDHLADHLGHRWEIMDVTLKPYPTSMFNQPPIHLMRTLTAQHDLQPDDIEAVLVEMSEFEVYYPSKTFVDPNLGYVAGRRGLGSTAFVVAATCVNRGFAMPASRPAGWRSPTEGVELLPTHAASMRLTERVTVVGRSDVAGLAPRMTITLRDGRVLRAQATGDEFKLDFEADKAIVRALVPEMRADAAQVERLIATVARLEDAPSVNDLIDCTLAHDRPSTTS